MREIRLHGRYGQPVAKLANAIGKHAMMQGKHVQIFSSFTAVRPGGPMHVVLRTDDAPIRRRSANATNPDIVIVLDNSLFSVIDVTSGMNPGGTVMALGVDGSVLGEKGKQFLFASLAPYLQSCGERIETGLINSLADKQVF